MGVSGLLSLLKPHLAQQHRSISSLVAKTGARTIVADGFNVLFQWFRLSTHDLLLTDYVAIVAQLRLFLQVFVRMDLRLRLYFDSATRDRCKNDETRERDQRQHEIGSLLRAFAAGRISEAELQQRVRKPGLMSSLMKNLLAERIDGVQVAYFCSGEADQELAEAAAASPKEVLAVMSNDSDFFLTRGVRTILFSSLVLQWHNANMRLEGAAFLSIDPFTVVKDMGSVLNVDMRCAVQQIGTSPELAKLLIPVLGGGDSQLKLDLWGCVSESVSVASYLKLESPTRMAELSFLAGNDYSKNTIQPLWQYLANNGVQVNVGGRPMLYKTAGPFPAEDFNERLEWALNFIHFLQRDSHSLQGVLGVSNAAALGQYTQPISDGISYLNFLITALNKTFASYLITPSQSSSTVGSSSSNNAAVSNNPNELASSFASLSLANRPLLSRVNRRIDLEVVNRRLPASAMAMYYVGAVGAVQGFELTETMVQHSFALLGRGRLTFVNVRSAETGIVEARQQPTMFDDSKSTPADVARLRDSFPFCIFPDQLFAEWWDMDQNYLNELRQAPDFDASQSTALHSFPPYLLLNRISLADRVALMYAPLCHINTASVAIRGGCLWRDDLCHDHMKKVGMKPGMNVPLLAWMMLLSANSLLPAEKIGHVSDAEKIHIIHELQPSLSEATALLLMVVWLQCLRTVFRDLGVEDYQRVITVHDNRKATVRHAMLIYHWQCVLADVDQLARCAALRESQILLADIEADEDQTTDDVGGSATDSNSWASGSEDARFLIHGDLFVNVAVMLERARGLHELPASELVFLNGAGALCGRIFSDALDRHCGELANVVSIMFQEQWSLVVELVGQLQPRWTRLLSAAVVVIDDSSTAIPLVFDKPCEYADVYLICRDCQSRFTFKAGEQALFASKQYTPPVRCEICRDSLKTKKIIQMIERSACCPAVRLDIRLRCINCGADFMFPASEQALFESRGHTPPVRCIGCRAARKATRY